MHENSCYGNWRNGWLLWWPTGISWRRCSFIARGEHLKAIKQDGLLLKGDGDEIYLEPIMVTDQPSEIGAVDVVLFCVKLYDIETAAEVIKPLLGDNTMVISVLNGVDGPQRLGTVSYTHLTLPTT